MTAAGNYNLDVKQDSDGDVRKESVDSQSLR